MKIVIDGGECWSKDMTFDDGEEGVLTRRDERAVFRVITRMADRLEDMFGIEMKHAEIIFRKAPEAPEQ